MTIKVTVNGLEYGLHFGMIAIEEMQIRTLHNMGSGGGHVGNTKAMTDMFFCSRNNYCDLHSEPRIDYATASEIVEELVIANDLVQQNAIVNAFQKCRATEIMMDKFKPEEDKKKVVRKPRTSTK